jgi:integrase
VARNRREQSTLIRSARRGSNHWLSHEEGFVFIIGIDPHKANPLEVAHRMGHTDPAITLRVYGHLFDGAQEKLTAQLDELREQTKKTSAGGGVVSLDERRASG